MTYSIPIIDDESAFMVDRIYQFIRANPGCQRGEIKRALDVCGGTVSTSLTRLRLAGKIKRHISGKKHAPGVKWEVGQEKGDGTQEHGDASVNQRTVTSWEPHHKRDPLHEYLFGKAA